MGIFRHGSQNIPHVGRNTGPLCELGLKVLGVGLGGKVTCNEKVEDLLRDLVGDLQKWNPPDDIATVASDRTTLPCSLTMVLISSRRPGIWLPNFSFKLAIITLLCWICCPKTANKQP
jgi:hypothetical protein